MEKISDPEEFAHWLAMRVNEIWEDTDGDDPFEVKVEFVRQLTGEKKWQVTVDWLKGSTTRVVID